MTIPNSNQVKVQEFLRCLSGSVVLTSGFFLFYVSRGDFVTKRTFDKEKCKMNYKVVVGKILYWGNFECNI